MIPPASWGHAEPLWAIGNGSADNSAAPTKPKNPAPPPALMDQPHIAADDDEEDVQHEDTSNDNDGQHTGEVAGGAGAGSAMPAEEGGPVAGNGVPAQDGEAVGDQSSVYDDTLDAPP